jgi:hypothetical protein
MKRSGTPLPSRSQCSLMLFPVASAILERSMQHDGMEDLIG